MNSSQKKVSSVFFLRYTILYSSKKMFLQNCFEACNFLQQKKKFLQTCFEVYNFYSSKKSFFRHILRYTIIYSSKTKDLFRLVLRYTILYSLYADEITMKVSQVAVSLAQPLVACEKCLYEQLPC